MCSSTDLNCEVIVLKLLQLSATVLRDFKEHHLQNTHTRVCTTIQKEKFSISSAHILRFEIKAARLTKGRHHVPSSVNYRACYNYDYRNGGDGDGDDDDVCEL
jgi:hypothetical protein